MSMVDNELVRAALKKERQRVYDRLYALPMDEAERQRVLHQLRPEVVVGIDAHVMAVAEYFIDSNSEILDHHPREELVADLARQLALTVDRYVADHSPAGRERIRERMGHYIDCPKSNNPLGTCVCSTLARQ